MNYRLERVLDYTYKGQRDIVLVFESDTYTKVYQFMLDLLPVSHFGFFQIVKIEIIFHERPHRVEVKDNQTEQKNSTDLSLGS